MDLHAATELQRPYAGPRAELQTDAMPTTVSYQLARNGPVGSLGLVRMSAGSVDRSLLPNAVANQPDAPSSAPGASLRFAFR